MSIKINSDIEPGRQDLKIAKLKDIDLTQLSNIDIATLRNYINNSGISEAEQTALNALLADSTIQHIVTQEATVGGVTILVSPSGQSAQEGSPSSGATVTQNVGNTAQFTLSLNNVVENAIYRIRIDYYDTINFGGDVGRSDTYYSDVDFRIQSDGTIRLGAAADSPTLLSTLNRSARITVDRINRDTITISFGRHVTVSFTEGSDNRQRLNTAIAAYLAANPPASEGGGGGTPLTTDQTDKLSLLLLESIQHATTSARVYTTTDGTETEITGTNGVFTLPATFDSIRVLVAATADTTATTIAVTGSDGNVTTTPIHNNYNASTIVDGVTYFQVRPSLIPSGSTSLEIDIPTRGLVLSNRVAHNNEQITDLRNIITAQSTRIDALLDRVNSQNSINETQEKILNILANQYVRDRYTNAELFAGMTTLFAIFNNGSDGIANPVTDAPSTTGWTLESGLLNTSHFDHNGGVLKSNGNGLNIGDQLANNGDSILVTCQFERINTRSNADDTKLLTLGTSDEDGDHGLHLQNNRLFFVSDTDTTTAERTIRTYHSLGELDFTSPDTLPLTIQAPFNNNAALRVEFTARILRTGESPSLPISFIQTIDTTRDNGLDNFRQLYFSDDGVSHSLDFEYNNATSELSITVNGENFADGESLQILVGTVEETTGTAITGYTNSTIVNSSYITAQPMFVALQLTRNAGNITATISANGSRPVEATAFALAASTDRVLYFGEHVAFRSIYGAFINTSKGANQFRNSLDQFTTNYVGNNTDPRLAFTHQVNHPASLRIGYDLPRNIHIGHADGGDPTESGIVSGQDTMPTPRTAYRFMSVKFNDELDEAKIPDEVSYDSTTGNITLPVDNDENETHWGVCVSLNVRPTVSNTGNVLNASDRQLFSVGIYHGTATAGITSARPAGAVERHAQSNYLKNFNFGQTTSATGYADIQGNGSVFGYIIAEPGKNTFFVGIKATAQSGSATTLGIRILGAHIHIFEVNGTQRKIRIT